MNFKSAVFVASSIAAVSAWAIEDNCDTPLTSVELADHWVVCEGEATTKDAAIDKAIKRGVSMVFGQMISAEDTAVSQSAEASISTSVGSTSVEVSSESMYSMMSTKTSGFAREYKVISVAPKNAELMKAHVHARIVNPRSGVDAVILVTKPEATIELQSELIKVGPQKTVSGREIANIVEDSLCGALTGSRHFKVRTSKEIAATAANNNLTKALVDAGMAPSTELQQIGQILTCDFILSTRLEKIAYSKKLGQDKATKKFGQIQSMKVTLSLQLTDVRTGSSVAKDTVTLSLSNDEIKAMLEQDEDADLLRAVLNCIVKPLRGWIWKNLK